MDSELPNLNVDSVKEEKEEEEKRAH